MSDKPKEAQRDVLDEAARDLLLALGKPMLPKCLMCGLIPEPATDFCGRCWYTVTTERNQLQALKPTIKHLLKSLWYEIFGPTWFSPYRQTWCVATNLLAAVHRRHADAV